MYSVDFKFWNVVLCMGLFFTSIRSIEDAYFKMQVGVDGICSEDHLNISTTVIGFLINKTDSEIWRCSNNCTLMTNCKGNMSNVMCLFTEADAKTIAHRNEITRILSGDIAANNAVQLKFPSNGAFAICSSFEYINRTSNLTEYWRLKDIRKKSTESNGTTNQPGRTSPPTFGSAYFKANLAIDKPCDENAILKATNVLRSVLHLGDKKIWRCQNNCTLDTNCSGGQLTFCLFFEADEYTKTNSAELNSSLSKDVTCGSGDLVTAPSPVFDRLHRIVNNETDSKEAQTGGGPGTGTIVGGTVGGLAGLAGAIAAGWGILQKLKKNQVDDTASTGDTTPITPGGIDFEEAPNSIPPAGV